jgi:hypothetical protein
MPFWHLLGLTKMLWLCPPDAVLTYAAAVSKAFARWDGSCGGYIDVYDSGCIFVFVQPFDHTVRGALSPPHTSRAPGSATQGHA